MRTRDPGYIRNLRQTAHANGRCYECCSRPHLPDQLRCQVCKDRDVARRSHLGVGKLCRGMCGRPSAPGRARCDDCLKRHRDYMSRRRLAAGMQPRVRSLASASVAPSVVSIPAQTDGPPKEDPGPPAEAPFQRPAVVRRRRVLSAPAAPPPAPPSPPAGESQLGADLSKRRNLIAELARARAA